MHWGDQDRGRCTGLRGRQQQPIWSNLLQMPWRTPTFGTTPSVSCHWFCSLDLPDTTLCLGSKYPCFAILTSYYSNVGIITKMWFNNLMPMSSDVLVRAISSTNKASILLWIDTSFPNASAAFILTPLLMSLKDFMKVVWSWGKNGFRLAPHCWSKRSAFIRVADIKTNHNGTELDESTLARRRFKVSSMAALTL